VSESVTPKKVKILLVEDNELNQKFALAVLKRLGYVTDVAKNGLVALELIQANKYDLVLMDIQMPEMNGIEATLAIRKLEAANIIERVPIIAVTAFAMEHDRRNCFDAGMDDFLSKPFKPAELELKIKAFL